jgi:dephospho-CoA kinase
MKVIGLTGTIGSGKEFVKEIIKKKYDCYDVSLSGAIMNMAKNNPKLSRKDLQEMGNQLRQKYGAHLLAKVSTEFMPREKPVMIVDGIRNPGEAEWLRKTYKNNFILVGVDAPQQMRFERIQKRGRPLDPKTFEEFDQLDRRDQGEGEPAYGQHVKKCLEMADIMINNDGNESEINAKMQEIFSRI